MAAKVLGAIPCPVCGVSTEARVSSSGFIYVHCRPVADGGCNGQHFSRSKRGDEVLARKITKWRDPGERKAYLGEEALPKKARPDPAPQPEPKPEPAPKRAAPKPPSRPVPKQPDPPPPKRRGLLGWLDHEI